MLNRNSLRLTSTPPPAGRRIRRSVIVVGVLLVLAALVSVLWPRGSHRPVKASTLQPTGTMTRTVKDSTALKELTKHQGDAPSPVVAAVAPAEDCNAECQQLRQENATLRAAMTKLPPAAPVVPTPPPVKPTMPTNPQTAEAAKKATREQRKMVVWRAPRNEDDRRKVVVKSPTTPYSLSPGWIIPIVTEGQTSNDVPGTFLARVREDVRDSATGRYVVIPQESLVLLTPHGQAIYGDNRMAVKMTSLTFPDGRYVTLKSSSVADVQGQPGFADQIDRRYGPIFVSIVLQGVLRTGSGVMLGGIASDPLERMGGSVLSEASSQGQRQVRQTIRTDPILTIRAGYRGAIILEDELALDRPWAGAGR